MQIINKSFYFFEYSRGPAEVVISFYMISSSLTIAIIIIIILLSLVRYLNEVDFREKMHLIVYTFISVILVSLVSFVGALTLALQKSKVHSMLLFLVSLAAGALLGDAFLHLLPEAAKKNGFGLSIGLVVLSGVVVFFVLEKIIHWHRCHHEHECVNCEEQKKKKQEIKSIAIMNLVGDGAHNLMDGILIAGSYFVSIPIGIATTVAVILHEVPQEIADFGVLLYGGFSIKKALLFNFLSAALAILGALIGLLAVSVIDGLMVWILPFTAGGFIYIAGADLLPELHKECRTKDSILHLFALMLGIGIMVGLKIAE